MQLFVGYDLLDKCVNGPKEELDSTVISQPAIFVSSLAALEKLKIEDPAAYDSCTVAMGLSLGDEIFALIIKRIISEYSYLPQESTLPFALLVHFLLKMVFVYVSCCLRVLSFLY